MAISTYPAPSLQRAVFLTSSTWTVPSGVETIWAFLVGGGAGTPAASLPGIGGRVVQEDTVFVVPGSILNISIGAGGTLTPTKGGDTSISGTGVSLTANGGILPSLQYTFSMDPYIVYGSSGNPGRSYGFGSGGVSYPYGGAGLPNTGAAGVADSAGSSGYAEIRWLP